MENLEQRQLLSTISGTVFDDANANGVRDPGEGGRMFETVYIDTNGNSILDPGETNTTTDFQGAYTFDPLAAGTYVLRVDPPLGTFQTAPANLAGIVVTIAGANDDITGKDFGLVNPGSITGTVFHDLNGDGIMNGLDAPLAGQTIFFDWYNNGVLDVGEGSVTTDAAGAYTWSPLLPGRYVLAVVSADKSLQSLPTGGAGITVNLTEAQNSTGNDFALTDAGTIAGRVFNDLNANGVQDLGEAGFVGWDVFIDQNADGQLDPGEPQMLTTGGGAYAFTGLAAGTYTIYTVPKLNYGLTYPAFGGRTATVVAGKANLGVNLGARQAVSYPYVMSIDPANATVSEGSLDPISLSAFAMADTGHLVVSYEWDLNYDGQQFDVDRSGQSSEFSAAEINAQFMNGPKTYTVALRVKDETGAVSDVYTLPINVVDVPPTVQISTQLQTVVGSPTAMISTVTDPGPGETFTYHWTVIAPDGTTAAEGTYPTLGFTPLTNGYFAIKLDVTDSDGYSSQATGVLTVLRPYGNLIGRVFNDVNGNTAWNVKEAALVNRSVYLDLNWNGLLDAGEPQSVTDASGVYAFNDVFMGRYSVRPIAWTGWRVSGPAIAYRDVTIGPEQTLLGQDFGLTQSWLISGVVFNDANGNRRFDRKEKGASGRRVFVDLNKDGVWQKKEPSAKTGKSGTFSLVGLKKGRCAAVGRCR